MKILAVPNWRNYAFIFMMASFCILGGCKCAAKKYTKTYNRNSYWYSPAEKDSLFAMLEGHWINKEYLDELIATRSPQKAMKASRNVGEFTIKRSETNDNELSLSGTDFHSGFGFGIELARNDSLVFSGLRTSMGVRISTKEKDTVFLTKSNNPEESVKFVRLQNYTEYINTVILAGKYIDVDNPGNTLVFHPDGHIDGLKSFPALSFTTESEEISYDIMLDSFLSKFDRIIIGDPNEEGRSSLYIFEASGDMLLLYEVVHNGNDPRDYKGDLLYKLRKA